MAGQDRRSPLNLSLPPDALAPTAGTAIPPDAPGTSSGASEMPAAARGERGSERRVRPKFDKPPVAEPGDRERFFGTEGKPSVFGVELRHRF